MSLNGLVTIAVWNHSIHSELASETQVAPMVLDLRFWESRLSPSF